MSPKPTWAWHAELCSELGILSKDCQATVLWELAWRLPQQNPMEERVPCFLQNTIHLLLPCGPFSPASLNSFYYLIHGITILILKVDLN